MANIKTDISAIMEAVRDSLVNEGIYLPNTCFLSIKPNPGALVFPASDSLCVISQGAATIDQGEVEGGGNYNFSFIGTVAIAAYVRLALDQPPQDNSFLTDATLGLNAKLQKIYQTLQMAFLVNADDEDLLQEPMRLLSVSEPQEIRNPGWGYVTTSWEVKYRQTIDDPSS
jgi:hypothetical protein